MNAAGDKPPVPLSSAAFRRGFSFDLGSGRQSKETQLRTYHRSGTVNAIISLLAESAATPAWHLYKKQPKDGRRRYSTSDTGDDQRVEIVSHAALSLVNQPNSFHSGFAFREGCNQHLELAGETFWVLNREGTTFPTSMWYVRPDRMEPMPDPDGYLLGWMYSGPNGEQIPLYNNEVILEKRPDPLDPFRGSAPTASIMANIEQQDYATQYQRNVFINGAEPGGIITVPTKLTEGEFDELTDRWRESHQGIARAAKVGILEMGATWIPGGAASNKDMDYANLRLANRDEIREAWRIQKSMLGTVDDVNRANAQTGQEVFVAWQIMSRLNRRRETFNTWLLPMFGDAGKTAEFDYDDPSPVNAEAANSELLIHAQAAAALVGAGYDPSAVLEAVGLPDMPVAEKAVQAPALPPGWVAVPPAGAPAAAPGSGPVPAAGPAAPPDAVENLVRQVITLVRRQSRNASRYEREAPGPNYPDTDSSFTGKRWICNGEDPCPACLANEADGVIESDSAFSSGAMDENDSHPNCDCTTESDSMDNKARLVRMIASDGYVPVSLGRDR